MFTATFILAVLVAPIADPAMVRHTDEIQTTAIDARVHLSERFDQFYLDAFPQYWGGTEVSAVA